MAIADYLLDAAAYTPNFARSLLLGMLYEVMKDRLKAPLSVKLLQHYAAGTGEAYGLEDIPAAWQDWIVKETKRRRLSVGGPYELKAYHHQAPYDLRHTLGTFKVTISRAGAHSLRYVLSDEYTFGYDCAKRDPTTNRHGFQLPDLSRAEVERLKSILPERVYHHRCGFLERFAVERQKDGLYFYIPQQFLAENGREFPVNGEFTR